MFDAIAPRYDLLNHVLSAGLDRRWRDRAVDALALPAGARCSTCAPAPAIWRSRPCGARRGASVVGVDFAGEMLRLGLAKVRGGVGSSGRIRLVRGDATRIPLADATLRRRHDRLRHPQRRRAGACARRARPRAPARRPARHPRVRPAADSRHPHAVLVVFPLSAAARRPARLEAPERVLVPAGVGRARFRPRPSSRRILAATGFSQVRAVPLTFGIVYLYVAERG